MLHELAMPGKDWRYDSNGGRSRLQATEMDLIAKAWAKCWFTTSNAAQTRQRSL
ncbi:hypothetical protein A2U01_0111644 [Trifolium medium]|uniref:Uncharacterized protein n=1 Tax=Trifolium medium TaxID=97028 RepID=A0A392VSB2_9FABA|nr:hypothetical protein [Trifolium medium]